MFEEDLRDLFQRYPSLSEMRESISAAFNELRKCFERGNKVLTCGNGGSAADADHIVGELVKSFAFRRPISTPDQSRLTELFPEDAPDLIKRLEGSLPAMSLMNSVALNSAFANDVSYEFAVAQQVYGLGNSGDVLIGISTSGNSRNILQAARVAKLKGVHVISMTGRNGGRLRNLSTILLNVPQDETHLVQELHLPIYHFLCYSLERHFFGKYGKKHSAEFSAAPSILSASGLQERFHELKYIVFDFDGVMTDNRVGVSQNGIESVVCNRADGLGFNLLKRLEIPMLILSTETNDVVQTRAKKLNIPCESGCGDKAAFLKKFLQNKNISPERVLFVGNDLNDLEAMAYVGLSACPQDAHPKVKSLAHLILSSRGGEGVVRDLAELITESRK